MDIKLRSALAAELQVEVNELVAERSLETFEVWDSATALSVMVLLGDCLGVAIEPQEMARLRTIADIESLVQSKQA